jgi:hypothetical protein
MAQDVISQLQDLCGRLREQLMQQPEYRALVSLEKTIEDLSIYMGGAQASAPAPMMSRPAEPEEPAILDVNALENGISMRHGADDLADALADALRAPKVASSARAVDHLPSHRVA